ncbi:hypothetical protein GCM10007301_44520 [Azorhizobium oxalatiphilum]|uniref:Lipoprotein n=1 Tax=Azorhizobium oxalatiphilum TaxID=980631 RepID=A0A917C999_9HYPH|nr:lipoprotein [Azorhizobium oxalatiphilum]GGF79580.1 hypothetical protein GCM10007301_44520 [Azorhizobium oxalatiphilum]
MSRRFRFPALALVLACAGTLAGCGVKGPLEPPQAANGQPAPDSHSATSGPSATSRVNITSSVGSTTGGGGLGSSGGATGAQAGGSTAAPVPLNEVKRPNKPFILDGLL